MTSIITTHQITKVAEQQSIPSAVTALAAYSVQSLKGKAEPVAIETVELDGTWALGLSGIYTALGSAMGPVQVQVKTTSRGSMTRNAFVFGPKGSVERLLAVAEVAQVKAQESMVEQFAALGEKAKKMSGNEKFLARRGFLVEFADQLGTFAEAAWKDASKGLKGEQLAEVSAKVEEAVQGTKAAQRDARKAAKVATPAKAPTKAPAKGKAPAAPAPEETAKERAARKARERRAAKKAEAAKA